MNYRAPNSEQEYRLLFESNPLPMWVYDRETLAFLEVNTSAAARYGYSREEFLRLRITDIRPPEDVPLLIENLAQDRPTLELSGPWRHRLRDGRIIDVEVHSHLIDWNGCKASFVVALDISERRRAADSLRQSEERFRTAFEHAPFGMCLSDLQGRFLQVNTALCKMLGYSESELLAGAWQRLTHPADLHRSLQVVKDFKRDGMDSVGFEKRYIHKSGEILWVRLNISVVKDHTGAPARFITHVEDITASRAAKQALRESEEQYRSLVAHIPDVVWVADAAGGVMFISPNIEKLIGLSAAEVCHRGACALFELVHPDDVANVTGAFELLFTRRHTYDVEFRLRAPSGEWLWVHDRAVATYMKAGVCYASGLRSDISERRRTEAALRARDAAEEANRTKSAFLANMSHELRTPLNAIIGYSQLLREDTIGPEQPEVLADLEKIERSGQLLLGIINDVLDLSKIEAGRVDIKLENVDLATILNDVYNAVEPLARQQGDLVSIDCPDDSRFAFADLSKLRQSILNLVINACKFTQNGQVSVTVRRLHKDSGDLIEVRVRDTGIGILPEDLGKLFQPFSQVDASVTRRHNGTGLGLTISKRFCQMMGGDIAVESEPGRGSCFSIQVPAAIASASPPTVRRDASAYGPAKTSRVC